MRRPVLRIGGPIESRNVLCLLGLAAIPVVAKIPSGFIAMLVLSAAVVLVQGIRPSAPWPRALRWLLAWCLIASFIAVLGFHPSQLTDTGNNFIIMVAICLMAVAVFNGGNPLAAADWLVDGIELGLLLTWLISIGEAITGIKMMDIVYPHANTSGLVNGHRYFVSALFPNYNDYSCAMVMLCIIMIARLVFQPRVGLVRCLGRWLVLLSSTFFIVAMGSRGSLFGLLVGAALVLVLSIRVIDRSVVSIRVGLVVTALVIAVGTLVWSTSYVQDRSTATRGVIITNVLQMLHDEPANAMFGYSSYIVYRNTSTDLFGSQLMDPHNMLLEMIIWYGAPALLGYIVVWAVLLRRGYFQMRTLMTWRSVAALTASLVMPILGVVPSSTLRYYVFWMWLISACAYLGLGEHRRRALRGGAASALVAQQTVTAPDAVTAPEAVTLRNS